MILDFEVLAELFATKKTFCWEDFRQLWIERKFNLVHEKLATMGKNRSETIVYTVYLRQCYFELLKRFVTELDLYRSVAFLYSLYTLYITQLGFLDDEDNGDNGDSQLPIVSIPIDLNCMKMINLLAHTCFTMRPSTDDVITVMHTLLSKKAYLICARMPSYVESPKPTPSKLTESSLSSLLKLDSLESLEKEYRESSQLAITNSIKQVIQELSTNESDVVQSAYTPRTKERNTGEKRGQYHKQIEAFKKKRERLD